MRVVNEYAAASDFVFVTLERNVDFPTLKTPSARRGLVPGIVQTQYRHVRREADERYPGIAALGDVKACAASASSSRSRLQQLSTQTCELPMGLSVL